MIPLSLYIHIPWCVRKCPYCDFNSHQASKDTLPEKLYVDTLIKDLEQDLPLIWGRRISSIFIGGGTPSLFSPAILEYLLQQLRMRLMLSPFLEITLEANPGTVEQQRFQSYFEIGINRLSLGIQSFQDDKLQRLGRIHNGAQANNAISMARQAGFSNFNIDLMFGLPGQTIDDALFDLQTAIQQQPTHLSWYQLTIEPNTYFQRFPPVLPEDDYIWEIQQAGLSLLAHEGYSQYEISAYSQPDFHCLHNRNYWEFGDYLGIGAGAHSKITDLGTMEIKRKWKIKHPKHYMEANHFTAGEKKLSVNELPLEFMLNALRLYQVIPNALFRQRTGLSFLEIAHLLRLAQDKGLLEWTDDYIATTSLGKRFLNDLLNCFI